MTGKPLSPRIREVIRQLVGEERSVDIALSAIIGAADEKGVAKFKDAAARYRDEYLRKLRADGRDSEREAGRLGLDEVRTYLAGSLIPRLITAGAVVGPAPEPDDVEAPVRITDAIWREVAENPAEVADVLRHVGDETEGDLLRQARPAPSGSVLEAEGLVKTYRRRAVVNDVAVKVQQGEIVGLLGPNGAGKTTTFYMIVGLIEPDRGRIVLDGRDITRMAMYQRARHGIGYLSQEPSIFRKLSVEDNILAILEMRPLSKEQRQAQLEKLLDELGLKRLRKSKAYALSGGERRRLEITRALVTGPKFMMLDEPFAGVDPIAVHDIQTIVAGLRHRGIGVLISDHNVEQTLDIVDRAYIMFDGQVKVSGTVRDLVFDDTVADIYLGPTLTARLRDRFSHLAVAGAAS
ncbi:MAG TPA: LPS export ABC transporter ATP-binding protein [Gemmatimonadaceae bacterium]|nr:LPS export ABC transporter ATP-binding protein [Gemmatimonadaceae bacterium]